MRAARKAASSIPHACAMCTQLLSQLCLERRQNTGPLHHAGDDCRNDRAACRTDKERHHKGKERGGTVAHREPRDREGQHASDHRRSEYFSHIGCGQRLELLVQKPRQKRAAHASRESQKRSKAKEISDQASDIGRRKSISGSQKDRAEHVDHVLDRRALGAEDRKGKRGSDDRNGRHHRRKCYFLRIVRIRAAVCVVCVLSHLFFLLL